MQVLPSYGNHSIDVHSKSNQLTGFYMRAILPLNGLILAFWYNGDPLDVQKQTPK